MAHSGIKHRQVQEFTGFTTGATFVLRSLPGSLRLVIEKDRARSLRCGSSSSCWSRLTRRTCCEHARVLLLAFFVFAYYLDWEGE